MDIPAITKEYRTKQGLTQQAMGDALGVTKQTVSLWENDHTPDAIFLCAVAMKCKGWRRDWAAACIEAHPRYQAYQCPEDSDNQPPAGTA